MSKVKVAQNEPYYSWHVATKQNASKLDSYVMVDNFLYVRMFTNRSKLREKEDTQTDRQTDKKTDYYNNVVV